MTIDIRLTSPTVYLDYCAIADLAGAPQIGERFKAALLSKSGTLYLSWAHLLEIYGLGMGPSYEKIRAYLASFGCSFVIMDCDAGAVIAREASYQPGKQNPALDVDFLKVTLANWDGVGDLNFAVLLETIDRDTAALEHYKDLHRKHRDGLFRMFDDARREYRSNLQAKNRLDSAAYQHIPGTPPTEYLRNQLVRQMIVTHEPLKPSDGIDLEHGVVSLAYVEHVVLDKKWAARVQRFPLPQRVAKVWKVGQLWALTSELKEM